MRIEIKAYITVAAVIIPMTLFGARAEAATGVASFSILQGQIGVEASGSDSPWEATINGRFLVESGLPGPAPGLFTPQPDWLLSGSFSGEFTFPGLPFLPFEIDIAGADLFSDQAGASLPTSAVGVVQQTLNTLPAPSLLYLLFGVQTALVFDALDGALATPAVSPWTGSMALGGPAFAPGDSLDYEITVTDIGAASFGGDLRYVLSGDVFGTSFDAFAGFLSEQTGVELPFFETMSFELRTTLAPIPVPAALPLLAGGIGLLGLMGWRRRQRSEA